MAGNVKELIVIYSKLRELLSNEIRQSCNNIFFCVMKFGETFCNQQTTNKKENIMQNISPKVLRIKECSLYLSMSKATFLRLVQRGELPKGTKLSPRCTVWKVEDLDKFIESKNVNNTAEYEL